jgi:hypothetical protein
MVRCAPGVPTPDGAEVQRIIEAMYLEKYAALNGIPVEKKSRGAGPGVSQ